MAYSTTILIVCFCLAQLTLAQYQHEIEYKVVKSDPADWFNLERNIIYTTSPLEYESSLDSDPDSHINIRSKRSSYSSIQYYPTKSYSGNWYNHKLRQPGQQQPSYEQTEHQTVKYCRTLVRTATDEWCTENCRLGYCPQTHCICTRKVFSSGNNGIYDTDSSYHKQISTQYPTYTKVYHTKYPVYGNGYGSQHQTKTSYDNNNHYGDQQFEQQKLIDTQ